MRLSCFVVVGMPEHELLKLYPLLERGPGAAAHLHLKGHTQHAIKNDLWVILS